MTVCRQADYSSVILAQRLLVTATALTIGTVAGRTGFASPYYFSRAFHRHVNMTPTAFRQEPTLYRPGNPDA